MLSKERVGVNVAKSKVMMGRGENGEVSDIKI